MNAPLDARVGTRGQITVPAQIREELCLRPGDQVEFVKNERGQMEFRPLTGSLKQAKRARKKPRE